MMHVYTLTNVYGNTYGVDDHDHYNFEADYQNDKVIYGNDNRTYPE